MAEPPAKRQRSEEHEAHAAREPPCHLNYLPGFPPTANPQALGIHDILTDDAVECFLTTYELELEWLLAVAPVLRRARVWVSHGSGDPGHTPPNVTAHAPRMPLPYGVNHGKLFVVFLSCGDVRVAVSTANLIGMDYERKTQGLWCQVFKRSADAAAGTTAVSAAWGFGEVLVDYVARQAVPGCDVARRLRAYDFSTASAQLVTCVPGLLGGEREAREGPVVCQFSSMGSLTAKWLEELHCSFAGGAAVRSRLRDRLRFVWPTVDFVRNSIDGWRSGGSLCMPAKNLKVFLKDEGLMHRYTGAAGRSKTYAKMDSGMSRVEWLCVTSANMSQAAWGVLQRGGTQLMVRHFEIGVLLRETDGAVLPYELPLVPYDDSDEPWAWDVKHPEPDVFGGTWMSQ
eukprot:m51a1_g12194 hypothetical protein (399) ;mRNA; f:30057-31883